MSNSATTSTIVLPKELSRGQAMRAIAAASAGTFIEWYEYGLYAFVAGLVIAPLFFPGGSSSVAILATFATFAVGFLARPFGGIVLGAAGDRWGRRPVLIFSIILMGVATTGVGLLPPFATIGVWAPILLVVLRIAQGFGAGAELGAAIIYVNESARNKGKAFYSSFMPAGSMFGAIVALVMFTVLSAVLAPEAFLAWGWRLPFLFGSVLTVIGLVLRSKVGESPEFRRVEEERRAGKLEQARTNPFAAMGRAFKHSPRNYVSSFLLGTGLNVTTYVAQAFGISYLTSQIHLSSGETLVTTLVMIAIGILSLPFWGWLSDRIGAKRVLYIGTIAAIPIAFAYFAALQTGSLALIILASVFLFAFGWAASTAAQMILLPALFRPEYRSSGLNSSKELQSALISGPAPLIATALVLLTGGAPWLVAVFIALAQIASIVGMLIARPIVSRKEVSEISALRGMRPFPTESH